MTTQMKYLIVVETTGTGFSSYSPDLDGCIATGSTEAEVEELMKMVPRPGIEPGTQGFSEHSLEMNCGLTIT